MRHLDYRALSFCNVSPGDLAHTVDDVQEQRANIKTRMGLVVGRDKSGLERGEVGTYWGAVVIRVEKNLITFNHP